MTYRSKHMLHFTATEPFDHFTRQLIYLKGRGAYRHIELAGTAALHDMAYFVNWDDCDRADMLALAQRPDVSRATVLQMYWVNPAGLYQQYRDRSEVPDYDLAGFDLDQALEQLFPNKPDLGDGIGYDPRGNGGTTDWTTFYASLQRRAPPPRMLAAIPGIARRLQTNDTLGWDGRAPTGAERDMIVAGIARARALLPGLPLDAVRHDVTLAIAAAMRGLGPVSDDLAWLWLDQLGWAWECRNDPVNGLLFGVSRGLLTLVVPDIVRNTLRAGMDPGQVVAVFGLLQALQDEDAERRFIDQILPEFLFAIVDWRAWYRRNAPPPAASPAPPSDQDA